MILVLPLLLGFGHLSRALKLEPQKDQFVLTSGSSWDITCNGQYPLEWEYPGKSDVSAFRNSTVTISHEYKSQYTSVLRVQKAHYLDTGYYICKYANATEPNVSYNE